MDSFRAIFFYLAVFAVVVPSWGLPSDGKDPCLTDRDAQTLANTFAWLVSSWSLNATYSEALANASIAEDFHDYSDSIRNIASHGCTSGPQPLDSSRTEFAVNQLTLPPFEFDVLQVWHSCDVVTFRWMAPQPLQNVTGIVVLKTVPAPPDSSPRRQISTTYSEFNTAAWLVNTGAFKPANCSSST